MLLYPCLELTRRCVYACEQVGKTTLMVKYVENKFDEDYIQTLGVNFMEKSITLRNTEITFSIWDLGGQSECQILVVSAMNPC